MLYVQESCGAIKIGRQAKTCLLYGWNAEELSCVRSTRTSLSVEMQGWVLGMWFSAKSRQVKVAMFFWVNCVNIIHALVDGYILKWNGKRNHHACFAMILGRDFRSCNICNFISDHEERKTPFTFKCYFLPLHQLSLPLKAQVSCFLSFFNPFT